MCYLCGIIPPEGGEGELKKYHSDCSGRLGWHSPLPLMIPLFLFNKSFPRDRVDPQGLKASPPLVLKGPVSDKGNIILSLDQADAYSQDLIFREIHGKQIPPPEDENFLNWKGVLLSPADLPGAAPIPSAPIDRPKDLKCFSFRTWQLALYRLKYDRNRTWWQDLSLSLLWKVRKSS
ncbi:MAG: hypothetical protein PQJ50_05580 [Spirochaetales bacterium]|nr:hypothetical protein [Spirochaetales bacterium]